MRHTITTLCFLAALPASAAHHPVFSLVDNRDLGHLHRRGGLYIEAGSPGMARYVHFSRPLPLWKLRLVEDKKRVALAQAQAVLEVPVSPAVAAAKAVYLGLKAPASTVKLTVGGKTSAAIPLQAGWQIVTIPLPEALKPGEATLRLAFANYGQYAGQKAAAAVEFIQIGGAPPTAADPPTLGPGGIAVPAGASIAWYANIPAAGALAAKGDAGGCKVTVRAEAQGAGAVDAELRLDGTPADLARLQGRWARVEIAAGGQGCRQASLLQGHLLAGGPAASLPAKKPPKNVVIWLSDSTRADKYRIYNPKSRVTTPAFDELAKRSSVFRCAFTQGNESRVSHASLWTSLYPSVHQMIPEKAKLKAEFVTLAEAVKPSGRFTAGVMGNGFIDKFWGFGDGWDYLKNHIHEGGGLKAADLVADARGVLDKHGSKPFFLYIGTIDNHVSWRPHEPWLSQYDPAPYKGPFEKGCLDPQLDKIVAGTLKVSERDKTHIVALYDSDVSYNDKVMGDFLADLKKRGLLDDTMFIMTADHGEEFWDHGKIGHGQSLRQELIHVPYVISYPPYFPPGKIVEECVDVMDTLPTITDALGVATPEAVQGESLIPIASGVTAGYPRPAIASQYELAHAMRLGQHKMRVGGNGEVTLYDAATDLKEEHDLYQSHPVERRALTDAMGLWMANRSQWKKRRWGVPSNLLPGFSADLGK